MQQPAAPRCASSSTNRAACVGRWVDVFTDVYFAFDIILNFRTAIMDEHGHLIIDNATIACSYLKGNDAVVIRQSCLRIVYICCMDYDGQRNHRVLLPQG